MKRCRKAGVLLAVTFTFVLAACGGSNTGKPPRAMDDVVTVQEDETAQIDVLANDTGTIKSATLMVVAAPAHGSTKIIGKGVFQYRPKANYNGIDQFKYQVGDGAGHVSTAKVRVTVTAVDDPPIASLVVTDGAGNAVSKLIAPATAYLSWGATDTEGDALNCILDYGDGTSGNVPCEGDNVKHLFKKVGDYDVIFSVSDGRSTVKKKLTFRADSEFNIELRFESDLTNDQRRAFTEAAARWEHVITGDIPDFKLQLPENACGNGQAADIDVDDLVIFVAVKDLGGGGLLGRGGPCRIRAGNNFPIAGTIELNSENVNDKPYEYLKSVILHEMGHVLGIGTLWERENLLQWENGVNNCQDANDIYFIGNGASQQWQNALLQNGQPPVENTGGAGTKCGHWREATFDNELMTGWHNGATQPLSVVTIGSLEDLGYRVDYYEADPFALQNNQVAAQGKPGILLEEQLIYPQVAPDTQ